MNSSLRAFLSTGNFQVGTALHNIETHVVKSTFFRPGARM